MKIEIEITPEEFKELFVPGETQQQFMQQLWAEWQKNMTGSMMDWMSRSASDIWDPTRWQK